MVNVKSVDEISKIRKACTVLKELLNLLKDKIVVGATPNQLDKFASEFIKNAHCESNFKGYFGYPATICVSVNSQLIHTIPNDRPFIEGDIVSVDAGCKWQGYHSDAAFTKIVGRPKCETDFLLVATTKNALLEAIKIIKPGVRIGTIGAVIQSYVEKFGFKLPTSYTGHGIGSQMHEEPAIPNVGIYDTGLRLRPNMVICIEPMVQMTTPLTKVMPDQWTVVSGDGLNAAHFEHTILITDSGCEVLT